MEETKTFKEHLKDLSKVALRNLMIFIGLLIINYFLAKNIILKVAEKYSIVAIKPMDSLSALITVDVSLSLIMLFPFALFSVANYVKPAYDIKKIKTIIFFSLVLFGSGIAFGYFIYFPTILNYFEGLSNFLGVTNMWEVNNLMSLLFMSITVFGIAFQVPLVTFILTKNKIIKTKKLMKFSKFFIIITFIVATIVTPTDPVSMFLLAIPIVSLYYLGVGVSYLIPEKDVL